MMYILCTYIAASDQETDSIRPLAVLLSVDLRLYAKERFVMSKGSTCMYPLLFPRDLLSAIAFTIRFTGRGRL